MQNIYIYIQYIYICVSVFVHVCVYVCVCVISLSDCGQKKKDMAFVHLAQSFVETPTWFSRKNRWKGTLALNFEWQPSTFITSGSFPTDSEILKVVEETKKKTGWKKGAFTSTICFPSVWMHLHLSKSHMMMSPANQVLPFVSNSMTIRVNLCSWHAPNVPLPTAASSPRVCAPFCFTRVPCLYASAFIYPLNAGVSVCTCAL